MLQFTDLKPECSAHGSLLSFIRALIQQIQRWPLKALKVIFSIGTKVVKYTGIDDNCDKNYARGDDRQKLRWHSNSSWNKVMCCGLCKKKKDGVFDIPLCRKCYSHCKKKIYKITEKVLATHYTGYYPLIFTDISVNSKGHCISPEIFTPWKINITSRFVNHVYTMPPKLLFVIKNRTGFDFLHFHIRCKHFDRNGWQMWKKKFDDKSM